MVKPPDQLVSLRDGDRAIIGTRDAIRALVRHDRPVWVSKPQRGPGGVTVVHVRLVAREQRRRVRVRWVVAALALAAAGVGVAVWLVLSWVVAHLVPLLATAALVLLAWVVGAAKTGCPGLHCAGCKHR